MENNEKPAAPQIDLTPVKSSQIHAIGHDAATNTLAVQFINFSKKAPGAIYHYGNVTPEEFAAFQKAESLGSHLKNVFKADEKKYPFTKISH